MSIKQAAVVGLCLFVGACSNYQGDEESAVAESAATPAAASAPVLSPIDESGPVDLDARVELPADIDATKIVIGECMTPVDYINQSPATPGPYGAGSAATVVGWNIIASETDATPTMMYGVFKPYDQSQSGALLTGARVPRPDVAGDNELYAMAGFELQGNFPSTAGRYRLYIWTGSAGNVVECDSKIVISVQ